MAAKKEKKDVYEIVTARVIDALEQGVVPWHQPWKAKGQARPLSLSTGKPYRGINVWTLAITAMSRGYESPYWVTFKQAKERGGSVRKGEKGTAVVLWKPVARKDSDGEESTYLLLRYYTVFNLDQCDGVTDPSEADDGEKPVFEPIDAAAEIGNGYTQVTVSYGGGRAYYRPATDTIQMPLPEAFDTPEHFYGTLFHEQAHSTGHSSRLARTSLVEPTPFGSEDYSQEELVAEMAAAFLCAEAGIDVNVAHHAAYIATWLKVLKDDRKLLVRAAAQAQKAADYVLTDGGRRGSEKEPQAAPLAVAA